MEEKIKLIDEIVKRHPHWGVDKGWSYYVGGMKDSGDWYFRKMLDVPIEELQSFLDKIVADENKPPKVYTEQELADQKVIIQISNGGWTNLYQQKLIEEYVRKQEQKMLFGLTVDLNKDKK